MLARAACRVLSLFCAVLYLVIGVHGGSGAKQGDGSGSERKRITDVLLSTVAKGYPPQQALNGIRVAGSVCGKKKVGPAVDGRRGFFGK
jgi:hypothetical protein